MKKIYAFLILLMPLAANAQFSLMDVSVGYTHTLPRTDMKHYIKQGNGIIMEAYLHNPVNRLSLGGELNYSIYGNDKSKQAYDMGDGSTAPMNVTVTNSFVNVMATGRYYITPSKLLQPYVSAKVGYSYWSTNLSITDPDDFDSCKPIESDILKSDGSFVGSAGIGVRWDMSSAFKSLDDGHFFVDLSTSYSKGGKISYMSTDPPKNTPHTSPAADMVEAGFINTQTQVVHKHHVGYVYNSFLELMDIRLSLVYRFNGLGGLVK